MMPHTDFAIAHSIAGGFRGEFAGPVTVQGMLMRVTRRVLDGHMAGCAQTSTESVSEQLDILLCAELTL
jgi:hypothetical protein